MTTPITLESIYTLLSDFISKQESFNKILEDKLDDFKAEEKANHNLSHRMIMQSFEAISDIRADIDHSPTEPWLRK